MGQVKAKITYQKNEFHLSGELNFFNVMEIYQQSLKDLEKPARLTFNFSQISASNSAGLALIIEWLKYAKRSQKPIQFIHLPVKLQAIAKAAKVEKLI